MFRLTLIAALLTFASGAVAEEVFFVWPPRSDGLIHTCDWDDPSDCLVSITEFERQVGETLYGPDGPIQTVELWRQTMAKNYPGLPRANPRR